jgi:MOSC domain-containing protein YiiM
MKLVSIQVGLPREVSFRGKLIKTGIFKNPVPGPVRVLTMNIEGDKQADLTVHGGPDKAVYAYSIDTFPWWKQNRVHDSFENGAFGENLSVDAFSESEICIGDTFELGSTILQAAQPRFPCYKLGVKFQDPSILKTFMKSRRPGIYFRVLQEGTIAPGDEFKLISKETEQVSILKLMDIALQSEIDSETLQQLLRIKALPLNFRERFESLI